MNAAAVRIVHIAIEAMPDTLVVVDAGRRTYLGLSRDGSYWHCIRPARLDDPTVGDGKLVAGELTCSCAGGTYGQRCYWTQLATALEKGDRGFVIARPEPPDERIAWLEQPATQQEVTVP